MNGKGNSNICRKDAKYAKKGNSEPYCFMAVMPAKAGIQKSVYGHWLPVCTRMTRG